MPWRTSMRRASSNARPGIALLACLASATVSAADAPATWQVSPRVEHSQVVVNGNDGQWDAWSLALARTAGPGRRLEATVAREDRNGNADTLLQLAANGRAGGWATTAAVQLSPDPVFLPRWGYEVQADHPAGRNRSAGAGYRHLRFNDSSVDLWSTHMTFYRGDDELGVEYRFGRNDVLDHDIRVLQLRGAMLRGRNRFGLYLARGDYLFDALGIPGGQGRGWSANAAYARALTPTTTLRWELGTGSEADVFRQRSIAMSVQYSP